MRTIQRRTMAGATSERSTPSSVGRRLVESWTTARNGSEVWAASAGRAGDVRWRPRVTEAGVTIIPNVRRVRDCAIRQLR